MTYWLLKYRIILIFVAVETVRHCSSSRCNSFSRYSLLMSLSLYSHLPSQGSTADGTKVKFFRSSVPEQVTFCSTVLFFVAMVGGQVKVMVPFT